MTKNLSILIVDPVCPTPYEYADLETKGMGGTEASCLRIAHGLAKRGHLVTIAQRGRATTHAVNDITYTALDEPAAVEVVITLRDAGTYVSNILKYPMSKHYLWMHDVVTDDYAMHMHQHLKDRTSDLICVSDWHRVQIHSALPGIKLNITRIYGPMADYIKRQKDPSQVDTDKLIFMSSPHKGLEETLVIFKALRERDPEFKLYITNPGYFKDRENLPEGVVNFGTISHWDLIGHVKTSLCLFYPNTTFAETFGLVMAEANACGTPVIAHAIGAAPEVVYHPKEIMDCRDINAVVERVLAYKRGERLIVMGKKEFKLNAVLNEWEKLLND